MNVKGTIRYSSDRPCSFRMSTLVITLILLRIITLFTMPVPGEYNLKGIFITLWLTVGRARTERAWRVRLSPRARAGVVCDPDRCPRVSRNHRVRRASAARRAKHTRSPPPDSVRRKMLIACVAVPAVMFVIPPFGWKKPHPYSDQYENTRYRF